MSGLEPSALALGGSAVLVEYDLGQQVPLDAQTVGRYYQRFPNVADVLAGFGWQAGYVRTFVRRTGDQVPPTVTIEIDRYATPAGARRFLDSLRRNGSPSLSHFLDLAGPPDAVDQPIVGDESVAFEAGFNHRGIVPRVVPVRYYAFRRGPIVAQILVLRDGPRWPEILSLAREQDSRMTSS